MLRYEFRGKDKDNNWVYGDLIHGVNTKKGNLYILPLKHNLANIPNCHYLDGVKIENETIGQFTGLADKNGVEIYEDDIVLKKIISGYDLNQKIVATMKSDFKTEYPWSDGNASGIVQCEYEVIGNIYENPELI